MKIMKLNKWWAKLLFNIILMGIVTIILLFAIGMYLKIRTNHNKTYFTPTFRGLKIDEAQKLAEEKGFKLKTFQPYIADNVVIAAKYQGKVISAGTKLPFRAKVDLIVGKNSEEGEDYTTVPDLTGKTLTDAGFAAAENALNIGNVYYENVHNTTDSLLATVYKQQPEPNTKVKKGQKIDLWLKR